MYTSGSKDDQKLRHICMYNLALANFWMEEFDIAEQCAHRALKLDEKDRDVKQLLEEIVEVKASLTRVLETSRHKLVLPRP